MSKSTQAAQVYFQKKLYLLVKEAATEDQQPVAAWIREAVEEKLKRRRSTVQKKKLLTDMPISKWKGLPKDTSQRIDAIVYGGEKE